ncbi:hypothetical protein MPSEU_000784400 [Mayamaea pseudoterrestris]|nr:hypothetical protein MPSEU_000784400 [Mayamaea pseudoterrestris]
MKSRLLAVVISCCFASMSTGFSPRAILTGATRNMPKASPSTTLQLAQYGPDAISLFNNMKTPASIIAGALMPLGFLNPLPMKNEEKPEGSFKRGLRLSYQVVAMLSLLSELISVMWATVAVNQLTEMQIAPAESVWHLLIRDFNVPWLGTNAHFVFGMLGFAYMLACRTYFHYDGGRMGTGIAGLAFSGLLLMISIVNRGVSSGSGQGLRYGRHVGGLFYSYVVKLMQRAFTARTFGPLEVGSIVLAATSLISIVTAMERRTNNTSEEPDSRKAEFE